MPSAEEPIGISKQLLEEMLTHAKACLPNEACGLLVGSGRVAVRFVAVTNVDASPVSYTLDPEEHYRVLRDAEDVGLEIVGGFHSHPTSAAVPSATDVALAGDPDWAWIIVGKVTTVPSLRAWSIRGGQATEIAVH